MVRRVTFLTFVACVCAWLAWADAPRIGVVTGTVSGPDGQPMPGATVQLVSERGTMTQVTGAEGSFRFVFVIPGPYTVQADLAGFQSAAGEIVVAAGGRADVHLQLAEQMGEEIVITGEVPLINKYDVTGGGTMESQEMDGVLNGSRNYLTMLQLFPGVTDSAQPGGAIDVEGNEAVRNSFYVDGVDANFPAYGGSTKLRIPNIAIGQMKMESSGSDAEYGRVVGGVSSVIVKSGTNAFHGEASVVFTNAAWSADYKALDFEQQDKLNEFYELSLGGPLVRDRLFFFASFADYGGNAQQHLRDGTDVRYTTSNNAYVLKLDWRPSQSHSVTFSGIDNPLDFPRWGFTHGDIYAGSVFHEGGDVYTLKWGWAISDNLLLDTHVGTTETDNSHDIYASHEVDPSAPPWGPGGNPDVVYHDLLTRTQYNANAFVFGVGPVVYPRDQANLSLNWFSGNHDVKAGVDWQDVAWDVSARRFPWIFGRGYNPNLPGGFAQPIFIRYYLDPTALGGSRATAEALSFFVRDRFTVGDRWTFNLGLRLDDQKHLTDAGKATIDSSDVAPRLSAAYDVRGDSRLLLTASAGRYVSFPGLQYTTTFNEVPTANAAYDQFGWNPVAQDFNRPQGSVLPGAQEIIPVEPALKDEFTLGAEWAFRPNWVAKLRLLYWDQPDLHVVTDQFDEQGDVFTLWERPPGAKSERQSATISVRRRFRNNWFGSASYSYSETSGSCYVRVFPGMDCYDAYGNFRTAVENEGGVPLSMVNRNGRFKMDRPHVIRLLGSYLFTLGHGHSVQLGGVYRFQSGMAYEHIQNRTVTSVSGVTGTVNEYLEPAGSRRLDDFQSLDLTATWRFPLFKALHGDLRAEIFNVTNEQVRRIVQDTLRATLDPDLGLTTGLVQGPRSYRFVVGLTF